MAKQEFHVLDYAVFGVTVMVSLLIGIYHAVKGKKTTSDYLVGGRSMSAWPVAISLMVSFESSIMMLGLPAEAYLYGMQYVWSPVGTLIAQVFGMRVIVPMLYPLKLTSSYEYLELRFGSKYVRLLGTIYAMINALWYSGVVLYAPAIALEAVTGLKMWMSIVIISGVSVVYTSIGGFKAVIWTDVFQALIMITGIFAILIAGTIKVGSPQKVWEAGEEGGRMNFFNFDTDPTVRQTFWNLVIGNTFRGFGLIFSQQTVQRLSSCGSLAQAKSIIWISAPLFSLALCVASYEGIIAFAYYFNLRCDPLESGELTSSNQIIPYFVLDVFKDLPGMPGIFLAALFSASLSTLSSSLSSLAAMAWADMIHPLVGDISETKATLIAKCVVVIFGCASCGTAFIVADIGGPLLAVFTSMMSAFVGPSCGMFLLGCFCPRANAKGAFMGSLLTFIFVAWIAIGQNFSPDIKPSPKLPPGPIDQCHRFDNITSYSNNTASQMWTLTTDLNSNYSATPMSFLEESQGPHGISKLYTISFQWMSTIGLLGTMILGYLFSALTGFNQPGDVDPRYLASASETFLLFLPGSIRRWIAGKGTQFMDEKYKALHPDPALRHIGLDIEMDVKPPVGDDEAIAVEKVNQGEVGVHLDDVTLHCGSINIGYSKDKDIDTAVF